MDVIGDNAVDTVVWMSSAQSGKALDVDTPIATVSGWTTMGEIQVGDVIFDESGNQCNVTYITEYQYNRDCYEVEFSDGSKIVADAEHRWYVEPDNYTNGVYKTGEMLLDFKYGNRNHRNRYAIPVALPIQTDSVDLPIDPWLLGAWLGGGHSVSGRIYCHESDTPFIKEMVERAGHVTHVDTDGCDIVRIDPFDFNFCLRGHDKRVTGRTGTGNHGCAECGRIFSKNHGRKQRGNKLEVHKDVIMTFSKLLTKYNLLGNKHIPEMYLRSSVNQRYALLQGLMDTDGYADVIKSQCEYTTTSIKIANGIGELLHSLGIKHTHKIKKPSTIYKHLHHTPCDPYKFCFTAYDDMPIFSMPRKIARLKSKKGRRVSETKRRRIINISPVDSRPVKCITVDSPNHLYLAGESMIPTHNTEALLNVIGYYVDYDPAPMLLLQPTLDMGMAFSKDRVAPMFRDTPVLAEKLKNPRSRDSGNTLLHKQFSGGHLTISGANSPASLASRPIRIFIADEVDRYPVSAGTEGDPLSLGAKRTTTFWNRKKIYTSTPTIKGASRIEDAYEKSDQRQYHVPCPHCDEKRILKWSNIKWDKNKTTGEHMPETAYMVCDSCGGVWYNHQKIPQMLKGGEWIAAKPFKGTAGFKTNELCSPWRTWSETVKDFLDAKSDTEQLKTWTNTCLGETWEEEGDQIDDSYLFSRREEYDVDVPKGAVVLTMGVDVQKDRLECEVTGWGDHEESFNVDFLILQGDTTKPEVWSELADLFDHNYEHESGNMLHIAATGIDSGYNTQVVYDFVKKHSARRVYAMKGVAGAGRPIVSMSRKARAKDKRKVDLYTIGVDDAKILLAARLRIVEYGAGYCHFPMARDEEYFLQLTAEKMVTKYRRGFPYREWVQTRPRNEATDCRIYSHAALKILNPNYQALTDRLSTEEEIKIAPPPPENRAHVLHKQRLRPHGRRGGFATNW